MNVHVRHRPAEAETARGYLFFFHDFNQFLIPNRPGELKESVKQAVSPLSVTSAQTRHTNIQLIDLDHKCLQIQNQPAENLALQKKKPFVSSHLLCDV